MFRNRTFKVLSALILLAVFCAGQASAAPINHSVNWGSENAVSSDSTSSAPIASGTLPSHAGSGPAYVIVPNLVVGTNYRIVISGTINLDGTYKADAQWNTFSCASGVYCSYYRRVKFNGAGLASLNGQSSVDPGHTYTYEWTATSDQLQMYLWDNNYGDNSGSFNYAIFTEPLIELVGVEVTQVIQDLNNNVRLIAGKPTYVRAYLRATMPDILKVCRQVKRFSIKV